jgi:hypothetical protein
MRVKIRKGDTVEIINGRLEDKGKRGEVINVLPDEQRVVVQGVNIRTKHQRQVQTQYQSGSNSIRRQDPHFQRHDHLSEMWRAYPPQYPARHRRCSPRL